MLWYKCITLMIIVLLFPAVVSAEIVINEVYPAPKDGEFEWIELYNPDENTVSLDQYILKDLTGKALVFNSSSISPYSYALATSSAVLNNKDETVYLTKKTGETIQTITYSIQFDSDKSYSTCPEFSPTWQPSLPTKLSPNSCPTPTAVPSPTAVSTVPEPSSPVPTASPSISTSTYSGIIINEVMAAPNTNEKEWIELYNANDFEVTLTDWYIDTHKITVSIPANGYATLDMSSATFTNGGDTIKLLDSSKTVKDSFSYSNTQKNVSWGRENVDSSSFCLQQPTKGLQNSECMSPSIASSTSSKSNTSSKPVTSNTGSAKSAATKRTPYLYEGIIVQAPASISSDPVEEKEYKVSGYKTATQPLLKFITIYGFYTAIGLSLLVFVMILVKMKRYLYEKDSLMALALVTTICINGYYIYSLFTAQYSGV